MPGVPIFVIDAVRSRFRLRTFLADTAALQHGRIIVC